MTNTSRLWKVLATLMVVSFSILLYFGREIYVSAPPIPAAVKTTTGETLYTREQYDIGRDPRARRGLHDELVARGLDAREPVAEMQVR